MKAAINVITLGVRDLEKALAFYRDSLGLPTKGVVGTEFEGGAVVFFPMEGGLVLALYPKRELAKDAGLAFDDHTSSSIELSIGHLVGSKEDVNQVMKQAEDAGAKIIDPAHDRFWGGFSGYFQDPDGHVWEIAWNPEVESQM
ncbi:MAG: VOC family protein [Chloroflexi bacterium]|nr:VOC family protein [Chloroflexota bacterium]